MKVARGPGGLQLGMKVARGTGGLQLGMKVASGTGGLQLVMKVSERVRVMGMSRLRMPRRNVMNPIEWVVEIGFYSS